MISHPAFTGLVGTARTDITPPIGIFCRNWGAAVHDTAQGIHRPFSLTALAVQENASSPPLVLVTLAEAYSCIQQNVRAAFADREVVWLNLVNGCIGYLPPARLYDIEVYQVWQTPFDRGSLELVEQAAIALGRDLLAT